MVWTLPSQSAEGITSSGTPLISPTPRTTSIGPDTVHPSGRLSTCRLMVVGALPRLRSSVKGCPPPSDTSQSPSPLISKSWNTETLRGSVISASPLPSPSRSLMCNSTALPCWAVSGGVMLRVIAALCPGARTGRSSETSISHPLSPLTQTVA